MSKKLLLIATGGTIASRPAEDGLTPEMTSEELLQCIPEVRSLCEIDTVQPFNLDSTNMRPQNWVELVKIIRDKYESYDGFVITHGTDTMAYTASMLSYMLRNLKKPVEKVEIIRANTWKEDPKPVKGYELVKDSVKSGVSEVTGYGYQYYMLLRVDKEQKGKKQKNERLQP